MSGDLRWTCQPLDALTAAQAYKILQLRSEVFIVEQISVVLDPDGRDLLPSCLHMMGWNDKEELMAYARLLGPGTTGPDQAIPLVGRVVTHPKVRGNGSGRRLMEAAIAACESNWPGLGCQLGAQAYLEKFYVSLGFAPIPDFEPFDHHGIKHIEMFRPATK
ncbi:hypothetical protein LEN26_014497 [Aphanomyces euteiches]|nr:hypothetical protein LEN26_014497 [Aphanomyces euteiches]KAH9115452.1 hypothetical protein AeMF1_010505 [Aphanomyces euteiches]KAH9185277.1 hypothetical protein AeNC1_012745 [Aphanomyces euteiches]